jgi:hypothetical protein
MFFCMTLGFARHEPSNLLHQKSQRAKAKRRRAFENNNNNIIIQF